MQLHSAPIVQFLHLWVNANNQITHQSETSERKYQQNRKAHGGEERSWVLESINKHFDVIVEDDEDGFSSESEDSEDDESLSLSNDEDKEQSFRVSDQMRNIFKSVVCQITEKDETFNNADILSNLKHKLETYTSSSLQV